MSRVSAVPALLALAAIALVAVALALSAGSVAIDPASVLRALFASGDPTQQVIVRGLRLPRAVAGFAAGGCLALAGALLQVLLRNALADPYVLGVSGGAAAGALTMMLLAGNLGSTLWNASVFVIAIPIVGWSATVLAKVLPRLFGTEGRVAAESLARAPTRTLP